MANAKWDLDGIWNACFGPYETPESVIKECENQSRTPEDFAMTCALDAVSSGADFDAYEAKDTLLAELERVCPEAFAVTP